MNSSIRLRHFCLLGVSAALAAFVPGRAADSAAAPATRATFAEGDARELAVFERKAALAKKTRRHARADHRRSAAGAVAVSAGRRSVSRLVHPAADFLKLFPPAEVQPYVDMEYGRRVAALLEERCRFSAGSA